MSAGRGAPGASTEAPTPTHPARNSLQQVLGAGHQIIDPQIGAVGFEPGDRFLFLLRRAGRRAVGPANRGEHPGPRSRSRRAADCAAPGHGSRGRLRSRQHDCGRGGDSAGKPRPRLRVLARIIHSFRHRYDHLSASVSSASGGRRICGLDSKPPLQRGIKRSSRLRKDAGSGTRQNPAGRSAERSGGRFCQ